MLRFIMQLLGLRRSGWRAPTGARGMGLLPVGGLLPIAWLAWSNRDRIRGAVDRVRRGGVKALLADASATGTHTTPATR
ncbi:MAG: hypothetical protein WKG00_12875 [Polyangiaceae bacterium]